MANALHIFTMLKQIKRLYLLYMMLNGLKKLLRFQIEVTIYTILRLLHIQLIYCQKDIIISSLIQPAFKRTFYTLIYWLILQFSIIIQKCIYREVLEIFIRRSWGILIKWQLSEGSSFKAKLQEYQAIRYESSETLKLNKDKKTYKELDHKFFQDVKHIGEIDNDLFKLLQNIKQKKDLTLEECQQIHFKAKLHRQANIINENTKFQYDGIDDYYKCKCGCKRTRGQKINFTCELQQFNCLGSGIVLFFVFQKGMTIGLIIASLLFGIYTTYRNFSAGSNPSLSDQCLDDYRCIFLNNSASENRMNHQSNMQAILGIVLCVAWIILIRVLKYLGKNLNNQLDLSLNSSSDYAIKLGNLPFGQYDEKDLIEYMNSLCLKSPQNQMQQTKTNENNQGEPSIGMKSIQIIYKMQFCRKLLDKIRLQCQELLKIVKKNKKGEYVIDQDDIKTYKACKENIISTYELLSDLRKKFLNDCSFRKRLSTGSCIIEFNSQQAKNSILEKFGKEKISLTKQIKAKIIDFFCPRTNNIIFHGKIVQIQRAPEPSDIIWLNCQKRSSTSRMFLIFFLTMIIIFISFTVLLGLEYLQIAFSTTNAQQSNQSSLILQVISIITSIALMVVNKVLWRVLYVLLDSQYNHTLTNKIVSLMNKALFTTCINTLVLPLIVNVYIKGKLYGGAGLVGFAFNYHFTLLTAGLALQLFDPIDLVLKLLLFIRYTRNKIFKLIRKSFSIKQDEQFMKRISQLYEGMYLDIAETYILILTNIFHAAFYCHLSPPLLFFALVEIFLYYWINKYKITNTVKIPELTQILVFNTAVSQAGLVPLVYAVGSFFISYLQQSRNPSYSFHLMYQAVAIGLGLISFLNPGDILNITTSKVIEIFDSLRRKQEKRENNMNEIAEQTNFELNKAESLIFPDKKKRKTQRYSGKVIRLQNYYKNSNSLKLLAFEQVLKGKDENQHSCQLRYQCQKYFKNQNFLQEKIEQIQEQFIDLFLLGVKDNIPSEKVQQQSQILSNQ